MHKFSDFASDADHLDGKKQPFGDLVDKQIFIWNAKWMASQYSSDSCVMFQFSFEEDGEKFVSFTGSKVIADQMEQYKQQMPFETIIQKRKSGKHYYYTLT